MSTPFLLSRVLLQLSDQTGELRANLSAVTFTPDGSLWVGSDELNVVGAEALNTIERLASLDSCVFGNHQSFAVRDFIELDDAAGEIDIEGLDYADHYLWLTGSHSTKRKKPKGKNLEKDIARLAEVETDSNRYLIARIPLVDGQLHRSCPHPQSANQQLTAAYLKRHEQGNSLTKALRDDPHLGAFVSAALPSKENGFDIEGLAVRGNRLFLGLRGPVLRGWAILLEIELEESKSGVLKLKNIGQDGQCYKKHFLDLDGLGIRELCFQGEDLLILAGPTMDLSGTLRIYRLNQAIDRPVHSITAQSTGELDIVFDFPYNAAGDKAEGITPFSCLGQSNALLVVYDSPTQDRQIAPGTVFGDVFLTLQNADKS